MLERFKAQTNEVTEDHPEAPLLARSASVREPSKPNPTSMSPVGGLNHQQGTILPESQGEKPKPQREAKRRTVQVEYVAPQSQTVRGEPQPSPISPVSTGSRAIADAGSPRKRAGHMAPQSQAVQGEPQTSPVSPVAAGSHRPADVGSSRPNTRPESQRQMNNLPVRPGREVPRATSDSTAAFDFTQVPAPLVPRPNTSGSMSSNGNGRVDVRLPSRGSYGQPVAPAVATTNAQGRIVRQSSPTFSQRPSTAIHHPPPRGHQRSSTMGEKIFGRSNSIFSTRQQEQTAAQAQVNERNNKKYPPVSMNNNGNGSDAPRRSTDSRRSFSWGFSGKNGESSQGDNPRRFSLLPAGFSFRSSGSGNKDQTYSERPPTERKGSAKPPAIGRQPMPMAFGRGQSPPPTESGSSVNIMDDRPIYPPLYKNYNGERVPPTQYSRPAKGPVALQKSNRKFADAYEQEQQAGSGGSGRHGGSSGAARKVMDFFRRRGKARAGA